MRLDVLCDASTDFITHKEVENLKYVTFPPGYALDIIRGNCRVKASKVKNRAGRWFACIYETQKGNLDLIGYEPRRILELKDKNEDWISERLRTH